MNFSPYFKSPLTDLGGAVVSHQWHGRCQKIEEKAMDCVEAYGINRGIEECKPLLNDFRECSLRQKQMARLEAMRKERERQIAAKERVGDEKFSKPPVIDSY